jgi:hypothetical protein
MLRRPSIPELYPQLLSQLLMLSLSPSSLHASQVVACSLLPKSWIAVLPLAEAKELFLQLRKWREILTPSCPSNLLPYLLSVSKDKGLS